MLQLICLIASFLRDQLQSRVSMQAELLALRHQIGIYQRTAKPTRRLCIHPADRGPVVEIPEIGGLHHHYVRAAA